MKSLNGFMSYYCQSIELSQILSEFHNRKLLRKTFDLLCNTSKYDNIIESFLKVRII